MSDPLRPLGFYWIRPKTGERMPIAGSDPIVARYVGHGRWLLTGSDECWSERVWPIEVAERLEPPRSWS